VERALFLLASLAAAFVALAGCGSSRNLGGFGDAEAAALDGSILDASSVEPSDASTGFGDGRPGCPSTCAQLGANCGAVTDTRCGGIVECGTCPSGTICGGGAEYNVCGAGGAPDACAGVTCQTLKVACGQASDGCGKMLDCGSCTSPQMCGGDPTRPGQCGCTGLCLDVPHCGPSETTRLSGTVYDPAGAHPLYDALVYIPGNPSDPGLAPFPAGVTCDRCGTAVAGSPLVSARTAPDGTFTLGDVPVGDAVPLVVQLGRWRRQVTVAVTQACRDNAVPDKTLTLPTTHAEGDIPRIALLTGGLDPVECTLRKMGVADSEFTDPGGGGHVNFYTALDPDAPEPSVQGAGAVIGAATPGQAALLGTSGGTPTIDQYDMVALECEGYPQVESAADLAAVQAYSSAGGRLFASDFAYAWLDKSFASAASWSAPLNPGATASPVNIDLVNNPKGTAFEAWLEIVGVSIPGTGQIPSMYPAFHNTNGVAASSQRWLWWTDTSTASVGALYFTFDTPLGAQASNQCGRVVYSDWHAEQPPPWPKGATFPTECPGTPMTPQEVLLEFMLFDLGSCIEPTPVCIPETCGSQGVQCGPAGDGCGNVLACGRCPPGQTCGLGGPGKCGASQ
jgi:hypothetical protein